MAEEQIPEETEIIEKDEEKILEKEIRTKETEEILETWKPRTSLGKKVKESLITDIDEIFKKGERIMEAEIIDVLLPGMETDLLLIGQAKGKFGGGKRRIFKQTQKKSSEGNKPHFSTCALVGNKNGYVGIGLGKAKETVPARDKSLRAAKLKLIRIRRGCGSWECNCHQPHSLPFAVTGKCGSVEIRLMPAPRGKGLCVEKECAKILRLAGIQDVWSKTKGQTGTKINLIKALLDALSQLSQIRTQAHHFPALGINEGKLLPEASPSPEIQPEEFLPEEEKEKIKEEKKEKK